MDYRIKKIGDDWKFIPKEEWKKKTDYERLYNKIKRREIFIQKTEEDIKKKKRELREWKKDRTRDYHQLLKYHKKFIPGFSVSLSKNPKLKESDNTKVSIRTKGNLSWTIYVTVQGVRKSIYLGTKDDVNEKFDLIEGTLKYYDFYPDIFIPHRNKITQKIEKLVYPLIRKEMISILSEEGTLDSFLKPKIKGMKYLDELYKNSIYYEEPKPKKPKPKGKRMVVYRPPSS